MEDFRSYQDINSETFDRWVDNGWEWGQPLSHETFLKAESGEWDVLLTPTKPVPHAWFGEVRGKKILGLASGGGQQMPIFTACGAECTVLDYSKRQLESEEKVAAREGYTIRTVRADMTKPLPFPDGSFDLIFHPVSNDYVFDVYPIFKECYRILRKGGILLCGLGKELNFAVDADEKTLAYKMPFNPLENPEHRRALERDDAGFQFSHTLEEQLGGQLKAGFTLTDLYEDTNGCGRLHELNLKTYIATRAVKG